MPFSSTMISSSYGTGRSLLSSFGVQSESSEATASPSSAERAKRISAKDRVGESTELPKSTPKIAKMSSKGEDSVQRSRERNRVHARRTRERKKNQMKTLQTRAEELKQEQIQLKQQINEKSTASILVGLFATAGEKEAGAGNGTKPNEDPEIELLLRRPIEEIPDASKITELPALILPGQHNSKKTKALEGISKDAPPDDGIDYDLLGKDRSKCTPEELDKIRRERNRMHAKRTRDRKRLFMEEMSEMCKKLEEENSLLRSHLESLDEDGPKASADAEDADGDQDKGAPSEECPRRPEPALSGSKKGFSAMDQFKTLIDAAGTFEANTQTMKGFMSLSSVASSVATAVSASDSNNTSADASVSEDHEHHRHHHHDPNKEESTRKRRRLGDNAGLSLGVPRSITASSKIVGV